MAWIANAIINFEKEGNVCVNFRTVIYNPKRE